MNTNIISLCGKKNSGKDTVAKAIIIATNLYNKRFNAIPSAKEVAEYLIKDHMAEEKIYWQYQTLAFATKIKEICVEMYGLHLGYYNDRTLKEKSIPGLGKSPRQLLCHTADVIKNHFGHDVFVKTLMDQVKEGKRYIITDVRYLSEVTAILNRNGVIIKILRPGGDNNGQHPSETEQDRIVANFTIDNCSDFEYLCKQVIEILVKINVLK